MPPKQQSSSNGRSAKTNPTNTNTTVTSKQQRKRERNRRRRQAKKRLSKVEVMPSPYSGVAPGIDNTQRFLEVMRRSQNISEAGIGFLKCAFAPPDFAVADVRGVPDEFNGLSLIKRHRFVNAINIAANNDYYFILAPVPGFSYFQYNGTAGAVLNSSTVFNGQAYADSGTLFASTSTAADVVSDFRFVSNHIELIPTVNQMSWTGSIQAMRVKLAINVRSSQSTTGAEANNILSINGLNAVMNFGNVSQYSAPLINGVYAAAYNSNCNFSFQNVYEELNALPTTLQPTWGDWGQITGQGSIPIPGIDNNFDSIMIKISGIGAATNNSFIIKTWSCVEYKVVTGSLLYEYQSLSPMDESALKLYRKIISQMPTAVGYMDNEGFWERVLKVIRTIARAGSMIPGPYGVMAGGVDVIAGGMESLLL